MLPPGSTTTFSCPSFYNSFLIHLSTSRPFSPILFSTQQPEGSVDTTGSTSPGLKHISAVTGMYNTLHYISTERPLKILLMLCM